MVGGFSESPYLKSEIIKRFENGVIQVIPNDSSLFILSFASKGACS
jgi:hypothetical protein